MSGCRSSRGRSARVALPSDRNVSARGRLSRIAPRHRISDPRRLLGLYHPAGKTTTCTVSLATLAAGDALLLFALSPPPAAALFLQLLIVTILWMLLALHRTDEPRAEQVAIGIGARMGNGLLLAVLVWLVLAGHGATLEEQTTFVAALAALFCLGFAFLVTRPSKTVIGCKGWRRFVARR